MSRLSLVKNPKAMAVYQVFILVFIASLNFSCETNNRQLLVKTYWQLEAIHTKPELVSSEGAMEQLADCEKDDRWKFAVNGILHTYYGNTHCHSRESTSQIIGGWQLSGDGRRLTIRESNHIETAYEVLHLDAHQLQLSFKADEAKVTLSYRSVPANLLAFGN